MDELSVPVGSEDSSVPSDGNSMTLCYDSSAMNSSVLPQECSSTNVVQNNDKNFNFSYQKGDIKINFSLPLS